MPKQIIPAILLFAALASAQAGNVVIRQGASVPPGASCSFVFLWINTLTGDVSYCWLGAWATLGPSGGGAVTSVFGRVGAVTAQAADYGLGLIGNPAAGTTFSYAANQDSTWNIQGTAFFTVSGGAGMRALNSGAVTASRNALTVSNTATSSTASIIRKGLDVTSTGTWNGASGENYGVNINSVTGGTANWALRTGTGLVEFGDTVRSSGNRTAASLTNGNTGFEDVSVITGTGGIQGQGIYPTYNPSAPTTFFTGVEVATTLGGSGVDDYVGIQINPVGSGALRSFGLKIFDITTGATNWAIKTGTGIVEFDDLAGSGTRPVTTTAGGVLGAGTFSGNSTAVVTTTGAQTSGNLVSIDANGNHIANGTATISQLPTSVGKGAWGVILDGGGSAITTGVKGEIQIPYACTITEWTILLDQSGSIVIDIWKDTYANYPPTVADTITASAKPTVTTATKNTSTTLTGWTTSVTAGDTIRFNVDSITTATRATLEVYCTKGN